MQRSKRFNPLPPPKRGETHDAGKDDAEAKKFQSTPPAEARGDYFIGLSCRATRVSIHSPRRSEGRPARFVVIGLPHKFQSTPPAEARGDLLAQTETMETEGVSIHSPRRSEGRPPS